MRLFNDELEGVSKGINTVTCLLMIWVNIVAATGQGEPDVAVLASGTVLFGLEDSDPYLQLIYCVALRFWHQFDNDNKRLEQEHRRLRMLLHMNFIIYMFLLGKINK